MLQTDSGRAGYQVVLGSTGVDFCPVATFVNYLARRSYKHSSRKMVPTSQFIEAVRQAISAAHFLAQEYAGHSVRIGAATTAAMARVEDSTIQTLGR